MVPSARCVQHQHAGTFSATIRSGAAATIVRFIAARHQRRTLVSAAMVQCKKCHCSGPTPSRSLHCKTWPQPRYRFRRERATRALRSLRRTRRPIVRPLGRHWEFVISVSAAPPCRLFRRPRLQAHALLPLAQPAMMLPRRRCLFSYAAALAPSRAPCSPPFLRSARRVGYSGRAPSSACMSLAGGHW